MRLSWKAEWWRRDQKTDRRRPREWCWFMLVSCSLSSFIHAMVAGVLLALEPCRLHNLFAHVLPRPGIKFQAQNLCIQDRSSCEFGWFFDLLQAKCVSYPLPPKLGSFWAVFWPRICEVQPEASDTRRTWNVEAPSRSLWGWWIVSSACYTGKYFINVSIYV